MKQDESVAVAKKSTSPVITCSFSDYKPPFNVGRAVRLMLDSVPAKYLVGLSDVVLTNKASLSRNRRRSVTKSRGRKVKVMNAAGLYHAAFNGRPAWIEIFVDAALRNWIRGISFVVPFLREVGISDVLFHEVGHHIHYTVRPEFREKEDVADVWKVRLQSTYNTRRYRWTKLFVRLIRPLLGSWIKRQSAKSLLRRLQKGWISRAEHEESMRPADSGGQAKPRP